MARRNRATRKITVTQELINEYRDEVNLLAEAAGGFVSDMVQAYRIQYPEASIAEIREHTIAAIEDTLNVFGSQAAGVACDFFDLMVDKLGADATSETISATDPDMIDGKVRYLVEDLKENKHDAFQKQVKDVAEFYVKREAFKNIEHNCGKNGLRFARVPSGGETCAFCFMLSSRGFVYTSEDEAGDAGQYHPNCDCVIVPGFKEGSQNDNLKIEGYEPKEMAKRWTSCEKTIGGRKQVKKDWDALTKEKQGTYAHGFDSYYRDQIMNEVSTRDWKWLYSGVEPEPDVSRMTKKELRRMQNDKPHEWSGYVALSKNGFTQELLHEDGGASANIDLVMRQGGNPKYWELKTPEKGVEALRKLVNEGYTKWGRLLEEDAKIPKDIDFDNLGTPRIIVDNRYSEVSDNEALEEIISSMSYWTNKGGLPFDEAMLIDKNGGIIRIKR